MTVHLPKPGSYEWDVTADAITASGQVVTVEGVGGTRVPAPICGLCSAVYLSLPAHTELHVVIRHHDLLLAPPEPVEE